jgi:RNA methyltransferase, TrmH family
MITSPHNPRVKLVRALQDRARTRRKEGKIVLEGARLIQDALAQGHAAEFLFYTPDSEALLPPGTPHSEAVSPEIMRYMSDTQQPQGLLGVFPLPALALPQPAQHVLILDGIRDPGNLGTILRAAAASGAQAMLLSPDCVDAYNPKVLRAGMGAHFRIALATLDWPDMAAYFAPLHVYLADSTGELRYDQVDWREDWALIVGSEAHGAGSQATQLAQTRITIPMHASTESINAAMAASVILFEAQRQRFEAR